MSIWASVIFLDAVASPSTYPCQWVSDSFRVGDCYHISELCELVHWPITVQYIGQQTSKNFYLWFQFSLVILLTTYLLTNIRVICCCYHSRISNGTWYDQTVEKHWQESTYGVYFVCCLSGPSVRNELNRDFTNFFHSCKSKTCNFLPSSIV